VTFEEIGPDRTRVTATIVYEPEGFLEKTGVALGFPSGRVQTDLEHFRDFIEEKGREAGGWRGQIGQRETPYPSSMSPSGTTEGFRKEIEGQTYQTEAELSEEKTGSGQRAGEIAGWNGKGPRNVLIRRADGTEVVRPRPFNFGSHGAVKGIFKTAFLTYVFFLRLMRLPRQGHTQLLART
jgi:hypothetical protein